MTVARNWQELFGKGLVFDETFIAYMQALEADLAQALSGTGVSSVAASDSSIDVTGSASNVLLAAAVKSVFGRTGAVTAATNDYDTSKVPDTADKRYVTDAQRTVLGNTSGTNTGDQTSVSGNAGTATKLATARAIDGTSFDGTVDVTVIAPGTHAATAKATPIDADEIPIVDSAASNILKKLSWANLKATLKVYTDTLYPTVATPAITLGSSAAAGSAATTIRSDGTIAAFDTTVPSTQAFGDAAAVGTATFAARRDHKHAMPADPPEWSWFGLG